LEVFPLWQIGSRLGSEALEAEFSPWIMGHVLSDLIEALEPLIDCVFKCAVFGAAPRGSDSQEAMEQFLRRFEAPPANGQPLGAKLGALRRDFPEVLPEELATAADPLRRLRNCLTHGGGVVRKRDCDESGFLRVDGFIWDLVLVTEGGDELAVAPGFVSPGGTLAMKRRAAPLAWRPGERAVVSERDLLCIAGTLYHLATKLRENLHRHLAAAGRLPPGFVPTAPSMTVRGVFGEAEGNAVGGSRWSWLHRLGRRFLHKRPTRSAQ